jgi:NAD(P)H-dependent flavin oxidoreductase YrpB (nitropropane dioxygenase family)
VPTPAGEIAFRAAEQMETGAHALQRRMQGLDERLEGAVSLACTDSVATVFLMPALGALRRRHPGIMVRMVASTQLSNLTRREADLAVRAVLPEAPNLLVHHSNARLADHLRIVLKHDPELVITSVGSPGAVVAPLHDAGALVFADVASVRHAERAVDAGADGLVLLTAGAGGQTGWLNPFAFTRAVRRFFSGPIVLAGGISDGRALRAARTLGCDRHQHPIHRHAREHG